MRIMSHCVLDRMFIRKTILNIIFSSFFIFYVTSEISFGGLNLNKNNELLFTSYQNIPGTQSYTSLLLTKLGKKKTIDTPEMLTCFPEKMELLENGSILQIRNRYGTAIYSASNKMLNWVSSANKIPVEYTRIESYSTSPDGKWICYVKPVKSSVGQLVIKNVRNNNESVLVESVPLNYDVVDVKWAPDSSTVLYEKKGIVYFASPDAEFKRVQLPEQYRKIGNGTINSVQWTREKSFIYIDGDIVYLVHENELYTRGLYSSLVGCGTITGRLPVVFNSYKDKFWCDAEGSQLVVVNADKIVTSYTLPIKKMEYASIKGIFPLTGIEGSILSYVVFWTTEQKPVLWIDMLRYDTGKKASSVYTLTGKMELVLTVKDSIKPQLSFDTRHVAFTGGTSLFVYDTTTWKQTARLTGEKIISFVWNTNTSLYVGGDRTVRLWQLDNESITASSLKQETTFTYTGQSEVIILSSATSGFWSGDNIYSSPSESGILYKYDIVKRTWSVVNKAMIQIEPVIEQNGRFRVFTGTPQNKMYHNSIFVRSLSGAVITYPLYADTEKVTSEQKKVALVFDAMENAEGLSNILYVLEEFNLKGVFFINGEFIRRYPVELNQIISAGHECASSFYAAADLTDKNFVIDADFIKRGLARNEDEFFTATGKELSLLWHAPLYHENKMIKEAGKSAGYRYVKAFTGYSDRVSVEQSERNPSYLYLDAGRLIDALVSSLEDGQIIPINIGTISETRRDYLFEKVDLLISSILNQNYQITDVRTLLE